MSLPVTIRFANPDPRSNPQSLRELIDILNVLLTASVVGSYTPPVLGSSTPPVEDQDKIWHKLDALGRPLGTYKFYGGYWRRQNSGLANEYRYFRGNPATYFDSTGRGLVNTDWDGWALANGQNGTDNLSDKFIVIGKIDDASGFDEASGKWTSRVSGANLNTGGAKDHKITQTELPPLTVQLSGNTYDGLTNYSDRKVIIDDDYVASTESSVSTIDLATYGAANAGAQTNVPTLPPFYSLAICKWIGYA